MAKLYALHAGDFDRSVEEAEAAIEIAPNDAGNHAPPYRLFPFFRPEGLTKRSSGRPEALRRDHSAAFARFLKPVLARDTVLR